MNWIIVVVFAMTLQDTDGGRDMYVFTEPTYESKDMCEADITDPMVYPGLIEKLISEYKQVKKIEAVVCVTEEELKQALSGSMKT
jgi:hypothetical protein